MVHVVSSGFVICHTVSHVKKQENGRLIPTQDVGRVGRVCRPTLKDIFLGCTDILRGAQPLDS